MRKIILLLACGFLLFLYPILTVMTVSATSPSPNVGSVYVATGPVAVRPGFNETALPGNDDGYTGLVNIGFTVNFFGTNYTSLYVNNNGDLTFDAPLATYTPFPLTTTARVIIAPYFADVDTRVGNLLLYGNGTVNGHLAFGATWPGVGCFSQIDTVLDYFQVILIYRSDIAPGDFDIEFNYNSITWESGTASGGNSLCLGGSSSRVGFSAGTGAPGTFFELAGSGVNGAFLDSNSQTGLIHNSLNSTQLGRYVFSVRAGAPVIVPTTVSCSGPVTVGTASTCTVTVTDTSASPTTPTGNVTFTSDSPGSFTGSPCTLAGSGSSATCHVSYTPSAVGSGTHTITTTYSGDSSHTTSHGSGTLTVTSPATHVTTATVNCTGPVTVGSPSTCTSTVTDNDPGPTSPGGTVSFTSDSSGSFTGSPCTLSGSGSSATCHVTYTPTAVDSGTHTITGTYSSDTTHAASQGSTTLTVMAPALHVTTTTVSCTGPVTVRSDSTCTVTVTDTSATPTTPMGTVSFTSDSPGGFTGSPCALSGSGSTATCHVTYTPSAVGSRTHTITGTYSSDATHLASHGSGALTVTAPAPHVTTTIVNCTGLVTVGSPSTCTATVTDNDASPTTPTGNVTFTTDAQGNFMGSPCTLAGSGATASCHVTYTPTAAGSSTHTIKATYSGDTTHVSSSGDTTVTVSRPPSGEIDLAFQAGDCDDFENGIGQLDVLVNRQLVVNIPAGLNHLNGNGDYLPYMDRWVSLGPFDITTLVVHGNNTIVFHNPLTSHECDVRGVAIVSGSLTLLSFTHTREVESDEPVRLTFSSPPLVLISFTATPATAPAGDAVNFTATFTGGTAPFKCVFRFGDGHSKIVRTSESSCSASHSYKGHGTFHATVQILGATTGDRAHATTTVTIQPRHPHHDHDENVEGDPATIEVVAASASTVSLSRLLWGPSFRFLR